VGKQAILRNVNISKTVGDTTKVTINDWQEVVYYTLSIDTKIDNLDDLELLQGRIISVFHRISPILEPTTAKW